MKLNETLLSTVGVTNKEFEDWCKKYHKKRSKQATKAEFFKKIRDGKIIRNKDNKLVYKEKELIE